MINLPIVSLFYDFLMALNASIDLNQKDIDALLCWTKQWPFNITKCKVLCIGSNC